MLLDIGTFDIQTIADWDTEIMRTWAERLQESMFWDADAHDELLAAEFRIGAFVSTQRHPVAYASITPHGSPDHEGDGELWFDHLLITEEARGRNIMRELYERQIGYVRRFPNRRVFRTPMSSHVVEFSKRRGWVFNREAPRMPYGVFELPRELL